MLNIASYLIVNHTYTVIVVYFVIYCSSLLCTPTILWLAMASSLTEYGKPRLVMN